MCLHKRPGQPFACVWFVANTLILKQEALEQQPASADSEIKLPLSKPAPVEGQEQMKDSASSSDALSCVPPEASVQQVEAMIQRQSDFRTIVCNNNKPSNMVNCANMYYMAGDWGTAQQCRSLESPGT